MAAYGFYYALTQPVLKALVVESVGEDVRGRALGIYFFVTSVATLAASLITGQLWKHYGAGIPFYFSAAMALVAAVLLQGARRKEVAQGLKHISFHALRGAEAPLFRVRTGRFLGLMIFLLPKADSRSPAALFYELKKLAARRENSP